jgi:hypothetical protein
MIMKSFLNVSILCLVVASVSLAQEVRYAPLTTFAYTPLVEEKPAESRATQTTTEPTFEAITSRSQRIYVEESPPMPGLPPVAGMVTLKVETVKDPMLPAPVPAAVPSTSKRVAPSLEEDSYICFVSATVYDKSRTLLKFRLGSIDSPEVTAWSNIDFNHLRGLSGFEAKGTSAKPRSYAFLLGIGDESSKASDGSVVKIPKIPSGKPAFIVSSKKPNAEAIIFLQDIHALYRSEGKKMEQATLAAAKAEAEQRAALIANPPKPKDITIRFWKPNTSNPK